MSKDNKTSDVNNNENYSLNDDRRVKVLSPGAMVAKRFFRNRAAVLGLIIIVVMFIFSFIGGIVSPYSEKQFFYRDEILIMEMGSAKENIDFRYSKNSEDFNTMIQANVARYVGENKDTFEYKDVTYNILQEGEGLYTVICNDEIIGFASRNIIYDDNVDTSNFDLCYAIQKAYGDQENNTFEYDGFVYAVDDEGTITKDGVEEGYISSFIVTALSPDIVFSRDFKITIQEFIESNDKAGNFKRDGENEKQEFYYTDNGEENKYVLAYNKGDQRWIIKQDSSTRIYDSFSAPSKEHILGTDSSGMDMLTRLMYGGRVSLVIGFIVVFIETLLGVIMGGLAGYYGGWIDILIMRIVDIMYCVPSTPILIIIGATMDAMQVDPTLRMVYLMLILGFLGWPSIAQIVRGQILSLREQEFMTATEASGLSVSRRIFKHLVPNVMPQLIVSATMGLGGAILTEATLSFLGLGVRFPFASWGNIINGVQDTFVLTTYLWVWIPAGICILLTVLAFNLVGDGLRDAFDPKMKR